jgi:hypothetical protein
MARQTINTGSAANDGTGDTLRSAGTKINSNFSELYTLVGGDTAGTGTTSQLTDSGLDILHTSGRTKVGAATVTGEVSIDFPTTAGTIVVDVATQTLTNKTLTSPSIDHGTFSGVKLLDNDSSHNYTLVTGALTADRNINIPALSSDDTLVMNNVSATLTNKTLTTPTLHRPVIQEYFADSTGNPVINITANTYGNTTNRLRIQNSASGDATVSAFGGSTDIGLNITAKGNKTVNLSKYSSNVQTVAPGANIGSGQTDITGSIIKIAGTSGTTITLQDAVTTGTILHFIRDNSSGTQTVTPTNFLQGTTVDFTAHDTATLIFDGTNWYISGGYGYAIS